MTWMLMVIACFQGAAAQAQGTKQWTTDRFDALQRGTADGIAIRNDGRLEVGMKTAGLYKATEGYVWSLAQGLNADVYAGVGGDRGGSAAVMRISPGVAAKKIFSGKELAVQAIRTAPDGKVLAATSPDGRVYRMNADGSDQEVIFDPATTSEKPKYLWDLALAPNGMIYVATGAPAAVYRVVPGAPAKAELLFRTNDAHIRCLLLSREGVLWAGSDGAGVVYRFDTRKPKATPFAAYASAHREITSLAIDDAGALYAAAVGLKGASTLPPLPVSGALGVSITVLQPGSTGAMGANAVVPDGSEIDRIDADGTPQRLVSLKDEVVYSLLPHSDQLLVATGNRGRIYRVATHSPGHLAEVTHVDAAQATVLADGSSGVIVGSSNSGEISRVIDPSPTATYSSEVFDAGQYSKWGQVEVQANSRKFEVYTRTGNVQNTIQGWSDWSLVMPSSAKRTITPGRFAQWRVDLHEGAVLDSVTLNYLPRNVAPVVDDIVVAVGARITSTQPAQQSTVQIVLPSAGSSALQPLNISQQDVNNGPMPAQKDRSGVAIRWSAHDDNNDELLFAVSYRGIGETNWRLLKDRISDRYLSIDASLLPDGPYEAKVVASDGSVHTDADTLRGERLSEPFVVDTTPPVPGTLAARMENGLIHWTFDAHDATSPITRAEISIDAGTWRYVEPVDGLSDAKEERYDVRSSLPSAEDAAGGTIPRNSEHVLAVRVYDRAENMVSAKTVVR